MRAPCACAIARGGVLTPRATWRRRSSITRSVAVCSEVAMAAILADRSRFVNGSVVGLFGRLFGPGLIVAWRRGRSTGAVDLGTEDPVPVRRGDAEATRVVLEVVAHVQFAQPAAEARLRAMVMQRVVDHVVDQVAGQETAGERPRVRRPDDEH